MTDPIIQTICRDCIFKIGTPQTDCELDRLKKFKEQGKANIRNDYYVIDRFCNACRNEEYLKTNKKEDIYKQISYKFCVIINCINAKKEDLEITLSSLKKQALVPSVIYCVFYNNNIPGLFKQNYDDFNLLNSNFNIKTYYEEPTEDKIVDDIINTTIDRCNYATYCRAGDVVNKDIFKNINDKLNHDLVVAHKFYDKTHECYTYSCLKMFGYENMKNNEIPGMEDYTCSI